MARRPALRLSHFVPMLRISAPNPIESRVGMLLLGVDKVPVVVVQELAGAKTGLVYLSWPNPVIGH